MTFDPNNAGGQPTPQVNPGQPYPNPYGGQPPQQQKKKRRWGLWIVLAVIALLFVGCVAAVAGGGGEQAAVVDNDDNSGSAADGAEPGSLDFPGKSSRDTGADAGATVDKDGVRITAAPLEIVDQQFGGPLLCTAVTIVNGTDEQQQFNGYWDWKLQDPNGAAKDPTFSMDRPMLESGELAPGGQVQGAVCFDHPGAAGQYVVLMETMFSFDSSRIGWINNL